MMIIKNVIINLKEKKIYQNILQFNIGEAKVRIFTTLKGVYNFVLTPAPTPRLRPIELQPIEPYLMDLDPAKPIGPESIGL